MYIEALCKKKPAGPPLELKPIDLNQQPSQNEHNLRDQISERARIITADHSDPPKPRVQIAKSMEYPPGFEPKVILRDSQFLGIWRYPEHADTCAICRMQLAALCVHCEGSSIDAQKCLVEWGTCKHAYHSHCIGKWVEQRNACPICQQPWVKLFEESPLQ